MAGKRYRHFKGGTYRVMWVDVDEATGEPRVSYRSEALGYVWNRTYSNFTEIVDGRPRFELIPGTAQSYAVAAGHIVRGDGDPADVEYDIRRGERGKYAERYAAGVTVAVPGSTVTVVASDKLGNCGECGRTLEWRGYKCKAPGCGIYCAFCVHDWNCPKCGAAVSMVARP
jgi:hypothetical protein